MQFDIEANEELQFNADAAPDQLIVEPPTNAIHKKAQESIAKRVKRRLRSTEVSSIAERVTQRGRESASPVLDHKTGKLLKYRQFLHDPKHKELCTKAGANAFGRLAQGVGGRITGTNTIFFIHKNEIPQDRLKDVT